MPRRHMRRVPGQHEHIGIVRFQDFRTFLSFRRELQPTKCNEHSIKDRWANLCTRYSNLPAYFYFPFCYTSRYGGIDPRT